MTYVSVNIIDNTFSITAPAVKEEGALSSLNKIDQVLRSLMNNEFRATGEWANASKEALFAELKAKALIIKNGYMAKTGRICRLCRFFRGIARKEAEIESIFVRINHRTLLGLAQLDGLPRCLVPFF